MTFIIEEPLSPHEARVLHSLQRQGGLPTCKSSSTCSCSTSHDFESQDYARQESEGLSFKPDWTRYTLSDDVEGREVQRDPLTSWIVVGDLPGAEGFGRV
jgi:hypothetical protein